MTDPMTGDPVTCKEMKSKILRHIEMVKAQTRKRLVKYIDMVEANDGKYPSKRDEELHNHYISQSTMLDSILQGLEHIKCGQKVRPGMK